MPGRAMEIRRRMLHFGGATGMRRMTRSTMCAGAGLRDLQRCLRGTEVETGQVGAELPNLIISFPVKQRGMRERVAYQETAFAISNRSASTNALRAFSSGTSPL